MCATLDTRTLMPFLGTVTNDDGEAIIAYLLGKRPPHDGDIQRYAARGIHLDPATTASLAPSVADPYQNQGVASAVMPHLLRMARSVGLRTLILWGGVIADNDLAQGFYRKWGFVNVGEFTTSVQNYDMIADITDRWSC